MNTPPIHTLPQIRVLPPDAANTQRVGIWRLENEHKRVLRGVVLTPRAHIMAALATHFAPTVDTPHVLVSTMEHVLAHSELYQSVRLIPPSFLRWLIQEFNIKGEAYSTPLTCIDVPFHDNGIITKCLLSLGVYQFIPRIKPNTPFHLTNNSPISHHLPIM